MWVGFTSQIRWQIISSVVTLKAAFFGVGCVLFIVKLYGWPYGHTKHGDVFFFNEPVLHKKIFVTIWQYLQPTFKVIHYYNYCRISIKNQNSTYVLYLWIRKKTVRCIEKCVALCYFKTYMCLKSNVFDKKLTGNIILRFYHPTQIDPSLCGAGTEMATQISSAFSRTFCSWHPACEEILTNSSITSSPHTWPSIFAEVQMLM